MKAKKFTSQQTLAFIEKAIKTQDNSFSFNLDSKKHAFVGFQNFEKLFELKLPLPFPNIYEDKKIEDYLSRITQSFKPYSIILIQAGYSALGYFENGEILHHKAIRTYMTRKNKVKMSLRI